MDNLYNLWSKKLDSMIRICCIEKPPPLMTWFVTFMVYTTRGQNFEKYIILHEGCHPLDGICPLEMVGWLDYNTQFKRVISSIGCICYPCRRKMVRLIFLGNVHSIGHKFGISHAQPRTRLSCCLFDTKQWQSK